MTRCRSLFCLSSFLAGRPIFQGQQLGGFELIAAPDNFVKTG